jgi:hypothetical protein
MSDQPPDGAGPGWWKANDGKWYPPERHPDWMEDVSDHQVNSDWWLAVDGRWYPPHRHPDAEAITPEPVQTISTADSGPAEREDTAAVALRPQSNTVQQGRDQRGVSDLIGHARRLRDAGVISDDAYDSIAVSLATGTAAASPERPTDAGDESRPGSETGLPSSAPGRASARSPQVAPQAGKPADVDGQQAPLPGRKYFDSGAIPDGWHRNPDLQILFCDSHDRAWGKCGTCEARAQADVSGGTARASGKPRATTPTDATRAGGNNRTNRVPSQASKITTSPAPTHGASSGRGKATLWVIVAAITVGACGAALQGVNSKSSRTSRPQFSTTVAPALPSQDTDLGSSNTFPPELRDPTYSGRNGSEAEAFCLEINSPDMEYCQRGYNNLERSLNGG